MKNSDALADGGPAFAAIGVGPADDIYHQHGMSLRDWFAGQAMIAKAQHVTQGNEDYTAKQCYAIADAMLAARLRGYPQ